MSMPSIDFYFDFISPFGYFASLRIETLAAKHGRQVQWHAMLLGVSVLKVMGLKPLLDTPLKGDYIRRDAKRYMRRHGLQLQRDLDAPVMAGFLLGKAAPPAACCCVGARDLPRLLGPGARFVYLRIFSGHRATRRH
jgi:2-hydroxychromene-2-carboxylate isomerase